MGPERHFGERLPAEGKRCSCDKRLLNGAPAPQLPSLPAPPPAGCCMVGLWACSFTTCQPLDISCFSLAPSGQGAELTSVGKRMFLLSQRKMLSINVQIKPPGALCLT